METKITASKTTSPAVRSWTLEEYDKCQRAENYIVTILDKFQ